MSQIENILTHLIGKKYLEELKQDLKKIPLEKTILDILGQYNTTEKNSQESVKDLSAYYLTQINETFMHTVKKTKYVLIDVINLQSKDQVKFPVSVVYYDKQLQTKWCRPLVEFHNNFKIVK